jgi:6-pyruvoyltetrahydropterin/6-carboxytetrahydropterin synthase
MHRITRRIAFSYGHRLLNYEGKCARLHGHNALVFVTLGAERLNADGMILDFDLVKRSVGGWIEERLDHRMILHRDDPAVAALRAIGEDPYVVDFNPTAENLSRHIFDRLSEAGLPIVEVVLDETPNCTAAYRP